RATAGPVAGLDAPERALDLVDRLAADPGDRLEIVGVGPVRQPAAPHVLDGARDDLPVDAPAELLRLDERRDHAGRRERRRPRRPARDDRALVVPPAAERLLVPLEERVERL